MPEVILKELSPELFWVSWDWFSNANGTEDSNDSIPTAQRSLVVPGTWILPISTFRSISCDFCNSYLAYAQSGLLFLGGLALGSHVPSSG